LSCPTTSTISMLRACTACIKVGNPSSSIHPQVLTMIPDERASRSRARRSLIRWPTFVMRVLYNSGFSLGWVYPWKNTKGVVFLKPVCGVQSERGCERQKCDGFEVMRFTSTFRFVLSSGAAVMQPGMQNVPLPTLRSTMMGVRSRRTAYAARICDRVDLPWSVGPTTITCEIRSRKKLMDG